MKIIEACDSPDQPLGEMQPNAEETVRLAPEPLSRAANVTNIRPNRACALQGG